MLTKVELARLELLQKVRSELGDTRSLHEKVEKLYEWVRFEIQAEINELIKLDVRR